VEHGWDPAEFVELEGADEFGYPLELFAIPPRIRLAVDFFDGSGRCELHAFPGWLGAVEEIPAILAYGF
jgi:hypothetical protein